MDCNLWHDFRSRFHVYYTLPYDNNLLFYPLVPFGFIFLAIRTFFSPRYVTAGTPALRPPGNPAEIRLKTEGANSQNNFVNNNYKASKITSLNGECKAFCVCCHHKIMHENILGAFRDRTSWMIAHPLINFFPLVIVIAYCRTQW